MMPGPMELVIILIIVAMLFGVGKLPEIFGAVGKGLREFRQEVTPPVTPPAPKPIEQPEAESTTVVVTEVVTPEESVVTPSEAENQPRNS